MSDETRKQGSVLPLGESLAGFLCSDGVFRVKSGEFRRATVGEWWQDKANGRVYCVNSEYPQDILVEPDLPAPSQTEGGGPDDTKQVSKEQGASPSVTPAVTTDGVPVVREGREEESRFCGGGQNEARIGEMTGELNRLITAEVESRLRTYVLPPDEVTVGREARIELLKYIDRIEEFIGLVPGWVIDLWNSTDPDLPQSLRDQWRESGLAALDKKGQDDG